MKSIKLSLSFLLVSMGTILYAQSCGGSKSFFVPRPTTTDATLELALSNYHFYHNFSSLEGRPWVDFYVTPFFEKSRNERALARYFLPQNKDSISIKEDGSGDVGSLFFELIAPAGRTFSSNISIRPHRKAFGAHFNTYFNLGCLLEGAWLSIAFAAMKVEHDLCLREFGRTAEGTIPGIQTALDALDNPAWTAGHLTRRTLKRTGVDDVQFKLGYDCFDCDYNHLGIYLVATAPTGCRPHSFFLFEPIVGSRHGSFGIGFNGDVTLWQECNHALNFMVDVKYRFAFSARERRSFDLRNNGDWSRYLLVTTEERPFVSESGINFLTQVVKVQPRSTVDFWMAFHYAFCQWNVEVGYNLWWRDCERIRLVCPLERKGIFDLTGQCTVNPTTASQATINQSIVGPHRALSDQFFTPITRGDIRLSSGAHPRALTHKFYGAFSYNDCFCSVPFMLGFGGSYEVAHPKKNALEQWAVWGKIGISF